MTAQARDSIIIKDEELSMASEPLGDYLLNRFGKDKSPFVAPNTACWRGYVGKWELRSNKLYLIGLRGFIGGQLDFGTRSGESMEEVDIEFLFPKQKEVFADWVNDEFRIEKGETLHYVHGGYASICEWDIFLSFENGVLTKERQVDNRNMDFDKEKRSNIFDDTPAQWKGKG